MHDDLQHSRTRGNFYVGICFRQPHQAILYTLRGKNGEVSDFATATKVLFLDSHHSLAYSSRMTLSARNRLKGKITELQFGGVMAHVVLKVGDNLIESVITKRSAEEMKLKVGDTVSAIIKSTEVMLEKG